MIITVLAPLLQAPAVYAGDPWWEPVALRGHKVDEVVVKGTRIDVRADARFLESLNSGRNFSAISAPDEVLPGACTPRSCAARVPDAVWSIEEGRVYHQAPRGMAKVDQTSPDLGRHAALISATAGPSRVVVAVSDGGNVWRRAATGSWGRSLILLPDTLFTGTPRVTSIAAFDSAVSDTIYLGTDGYAVLISSDGGDDWVRAGPGLPRSVYALAADSASRSVYAGTSDGLWVHHLQRLPAPPVYSDRDLWLRWIGVIAVCAVAALIALIALITLVRRQQQS
ncbi:MAG TPA: hypothetical protein VE219_06800 [Candidatus Sulfotelmatobacter sp.]|nr:hypothetical protein [Candidatus Sulfotelmatobacter sp.]